MLLQVDKLRKIYPGDRGLQPTSFSVAEGESVAIVGHNGAGKSTLLKILANWLVADGGRVSVAGIDLGNRTELTRKLGFVAEVPNLFDFFSVEYNLKLFARLFGLPAARVGEIMVEFDLLPHRRGKVRDLSKGLKQRVSIGRSLLADPPVLLFDEPSSGLDFEMTKEVHRLLKEKHAAGKTLLFTSHRPEEIKSLATRILLLHQGKVIFDGPPADYFQSQIHQNLYQNLCP